MSYQNPRIAEVADLLADRLAGLHDKTEILKAVELKALYAEIPTLPTEERGAFGKEINILKADLERQVAEHQEQAEALPPIDVTAPFDSNTSADKRPDLLNPMSGSKHPLMTELDAVLDIF